MFSSFLPKFGGAPGPNRLRVTRSSRADHIYLQQLVVEIGQRLRDLGRDPAEIDGLHGPDIAVVASIANLEAFKVSILKDNEVSHHVIIYGDRYLKLAGTPFPPPSPNATVDELRSWCGTVALEYYRMRESNKSKAEELGGWVLGATVYTLGFILAVLLYLWASQEYDHVHQRVIPPFVLSMGAGALGGLVNQFRRMLSPKFPMGTDLLSHELILLKKGFGAPVVAGMMYGLVVLLIAGSGITSAEKSGLFSNFLPSIKTVDEVGLRALFESRPATAEYAKLLVWCFASGLIPSLVPDFVQGLIDRSSANPKTPGGPNPNLNPNSGQNPGSKASE